MIERVKEWIKDNREISIMILIGLFMIIMLFVVSYYEVKDCQDKGGKFEGDGTYSTIFVNSGDFIIPIENENMSCSE